MPRRWTWSIAPRRGGTCMRPILYAPSQENDRSESRRARRPPRQFPKDRFVWCAEEQVYVCPQGHRLERIGQERRARGEGRSIALTTYRCAKEHCQACPLAQQCTTGARGRTIKRSEHEEVIVAH